MKMWVKKIASFFCYTDRTSNLDELGVKRFEAELKAREFRWYILMLKFALPAAIVTIGAVCGYMKTADKDREINDKKFKYDMIVRAINFDDPVKTNRNFDLLKSFNILSLEEVKAVKDVLDGDELYVSTDDTTKFFTYSPKTFTGWSTGPIGIELTKSGFVTISYTITLKKDVSQLTWYLDLIDNRKDIPLRLGDTHKILIDSTQIPGLERRKIKVITQKTRLYIDSLDFEKVDQINTWAYPD